MTTRVSLLALSLAALVTSPGCSYVFVTPPHDTYGGRAAGNCTTSRAAPFVDTIFVGTNLVTALYVASEDNVANKGTSVGLGLSVAAFWLSSAIYGYYNTSQCEELLSEDARPFYHPPPVRRPAWQPPPPVSPPPPAAPQALPPPDWARTPQQPAPAAVPAPGAAAPPPAPAAPE